MDPQRNQKNQQLRRSCCQTHKPHAQHGGWRAGGRECHTQQSETKMDLQTVRRSAAERDAEPLRRATVGKPIDIFSSKSAEYVRRMANSVACLPHPPSPTPADVSRCAGTHIPNSHGAPARTPDPHRNGSTKKHTTETPKKQHTLQNTRRVCTNRIRAGANSSSACRSGSRACAVREQHLSRCHGRRFARTRCVNRSDRLRVRGFA